MLAQPERHPPVQLNRPAAAVLVTLLTAAQGWQAWTMLMPFEFARSYWVFTYDHGFVRRGAGGEMARLLFADTQAGSVLMPPIASAVGVTGVMSVIAALVWKGSQTRLIVAVVLAASPGTIEFAIRQARPDIIGYALIPLAFLAARSRWLWAVSAGWTGLILIHEGVVLSVGPWLLAAVALRLAPHLRAWLLRLFLLPAVASTAVLVAGRPSALQMTLLRSDAAYLDSQQTTLLKFIGDSLPASVDLVLRDFSWSTAVLTLGLGLFLVAAHFLAFRSAGVTWPSNKPVALAVMVSIIAVAVEMLIGTDWMRWVGMWIGGATLVTGLATVVQDEGVPKRYWWLTVLLIAVVPPLPDHFGAGSVQRALERFLRLFS